MTQPTARSSKQVAVGLAEIAVGNEPDQLLIARGVGSCVVLCAWDAVRRVAGMAHVVQPRSPCGGRRDARYADQAVPLLLQRLAEFESRPRDLVFKMAGGASLLLPGGHAPGETLGQANERALDRALGQYGLRAAAREVGGTHGRTVLLEVLTGAVVVRSLKAQETVI